MTRTAAFASAVSGVAVLISAYTGNPWVAVVAASLFVFVLFPRWRRRLERLIDKAIGLLGNPMTGRGHDRCDPPLD